MKYYSRALLVSLLLMSNLGISQNNSFRIIFDSINPIVSDNYPKAKRIMRSLERKYQVDPAEKLNFLYVSLENNDIHYFKREIKKMLKYHGFKFSKHDKSRNSFQNSFVELVNSKQLGDWLCEKSDKYYPRWIKNHPEAFEIKRKIDELFIKDQMRVDIYIQDSLCSQIILGQINAIDKNNLKSLLQLCDSKGILPNHIDHGVGTYYPWQTILLHNMKSDDFFEVWEEILPYIEKTYFAGKIGDDLFRLYDQMLHQFFGYQFFGFEKNAPIKDPEHLIERKRKYGFL